MKDDLCSPFPLINFDDLPTEAGTVVPSVEGADIFGYVNTFPDQLDPDIAADVPMSTDSQFQDWTVDGDSAANGSGWMADERTG